MDIKKILPSKKFSIFIAIALGCGILIFVILRIVDKKTNLSQFSQNIATQNVIQEMDTDNDGVKDWEEPLWGLDPNNPDTDGDGILDGQEVEIRKKELKFSEEYIEIDEEPKTQTEKIARQLLTLALNINQSSGGNLTQEEILAIAKSTIPNDPPQLVNAYSIGDLKISTTKTAQSYYNEMSLALESLNSTPTNELAILEQAMATNRKRLLKDLEPIIQAYAEAPSKVIDKEIPSAVAQAHLEYLNALIQKSVAITYMAEYFDDPVVSMEGIKQYTVADANLTNAVKKISQYLQNSGIVR